MTKMLTGTPPIQRNRSVVASYTRYSNVALAVRRLSFDGLPIGEISIIGRNFETTADLQGIYQPAVAAVDAPKGGAWFGEIFGGILARTDIAVGFFILPLVGAVLVFGPLAEHIGRAIGSVGGAAVNALVDGLGAIGVPHDRAMKIQERLRDGEFLIILNGSTDDAERAQYLLQGTAHSHLQAYSG